MLWGTGYSINWHLHIRNSFLSQSLHDFFSIPEINTVARAGGYTGRLQTSIKPFHTQVTFLGNLPHLIKLHHPKGATFDAVLAAITKLRSNDSNAVLPGAYGTDGQAS